MQITRKSSWLAGGAIGLLAVVAVPSIAMATSSVPPSQPAAQPVSQPLAPSVDPGAADTQLVTAAVASDNKRACAVMVPRVEKRLTDRIAALTTGKGSASALATAATKAAGAGHQLRADALTYRASTVDERLTLLHNAQQEIQQLAAKYCSSATG